MLPSVLNWPNPGWWTSIARKRAWAGILTAWEKRAHKWLRIRPTISIKMVRKSWRAFFPSKMRHLVIICAFVWTFNLERSQKPEALFHSVYYQKWKNAKGGWERTREREWNQSHPMFFGHFSFIGMTDRCVSRVKEAQWAVVRHSMTMPFSLQHSPCPVKNGFGADRPFTTEMWQRK